MKENDNEVDTDVAQLERSNNKCYALAFRYIYRFGLTAHDEKFLTIIFLLLRYVLQ